MEFRDLKTQYQMLKTDIDSAIAEVLEEGSYIMGRQVAQLEEKLAKYIGVKHCITCANGTDALTLVLMALGVEPGDAVFIPNFTFFATGEVVSFEGATPIFVDIDENTFNINVEKLEEAIEEVIAEGRLNPKAIIAVDLFGLPADYEALERISKEYNLILIEDGAQGFGGRIGDRKACGFGNIATTSFFPAKPLGCYGDGGAIFTDDDNMAELLKSLRVHGKGSCKYDNVRIGMNSRLDTIQAVILMQKLRAFVEYELEAVNKVAQLYTDELKEVVKAPIVPEGYYSSWAQYSIVCKNEEQRQRIIEHLREKEIPSMVYYPKTMNQQMAFKNEMRIEEVFEVSERISKTILSLPMHPYLKEEEVKAICKEVKKIIYMEKGYNE